MGCVKTGRLECRGPKPLVIEGSRASQGLVRVDLLRKLRTEFKNKIISGGEG